MIVLDASALLEVLLGGPASGVLAERLFAPEETLHVPHLLDLEVLQVLRRYVMAREIDARKAAEALEDLASMPLTRCPQDLFVQRIWQLRNRMTAYDAAYVSLAEALNAPLLTRDRRLAASGGHRARIEAV